MVDDDALGLMEKKPVIMARKEFAFTTDAKKLDAFNTWFQQQVQAHVLSPGNQQMPVGSIATGPWTVNYVQSAYRQGMLNAYLSSKAADNSITQTQQQFMQEAFGAPEAMSKVELLGTRTFEELKGVTATMSSQMNQILAQGIADGDGAQEIADEMTDTIDGLTDTRALTIARTETIYAHAEGQLDSFDQLGVEDLGVLAEWSTAGDDRVCEECEDMEGKTFTIDEARGLIPLHPNCRCTWIPSEPKKEDTVE